MVDHKEWLTIYDIMRQTSLNETTARRYASLFGEFLNSKTFGRVTKNSPEAIEVFRHVNNLYGQGFVTQDIISHLEQEMPRTIEVDIRQDHPPQDSSIILNQAAVVMLLQTLTKELQTLRREVVELNDRQDQGFQGLKQETHQIHKNTEEVLRRDVVELKNEIAATKELLNIQEQARIQAEEARRKVEDERDRLALERDQRMIEKMREMLEENRRQPWWKRILGK